MKVEVIELNQAVKVKVDTPCGNKWHQIIGCKDPRDKELVAKTVYERLLDDKSVSSSVAKGVFFQLLKVAGLSTTKSWIVYLAVWGAKKIFKK